MPKLLFIFLLASNFWVYEINQGVNLRKGPDNKKKVLTTVPKGQTITVLEETNQWWWKVEYKGTKGYIASSFISKSYPKTIFNTIENYPYQSIAIAIVPILFILRLRKKRTSRKRKP